MNRNRHNLRLDQKQTVAFDSLPENQARPLHAGKCGPHQQGVVDAGGRASFGPCGAWWGVWVWVEV